MFQLHESTWLTPLQSNEPVEIDNDMVPLVRALWARGWQTMACCQDDGEAVDAERRQGQRNEPTGHRGFIEYHKGWAWLKMPGTDTLSLLTELSEHEIFGPRIKIRWQRGSWRIHIPIIYQDGQIGPSSYAQIYFPKEQIEELTVAIAALG
jgi:hypothetical protein